MVDKMYITHVHTTIPAADAFFPKIDPEIWHVDSASEPFTDPASGLSYDFRVYLRVPRKSSAPLPQDP